ncbi:MAG: TlpA family protein disulfide reductase [Deltaproteobacteria bacterium]|nr:TlpA family protein disulfide reductase [Deltaproteobacteria bacterium]
MTTVGFATRLGLVVTNPRWALALAADRNHAGRSGSDLIALIGLLLLATQLRGLFAAAWLAREVDTGLGLRGVMHVLTRALTVNLGFLVLAAFLVFVLSGIKRNLGRAFDLACITAMPLVLVELTATVVVRALDAQVPGALSVALGGLSFTWAGVLLVLAIRPAREAATTAPSPPAAEITRGRLAGWIIVAVAVIGTVVQVTWIARNTELMRPMTHGDPAPRFALPAIGPKGALGAPVALAASQGKVTVLDFWATWCGPCLRAMPQLDRIATRHAGDVAVIAVNLDDPAEARALFDERGYKMALLYDDGQVSQRYGVTTIPHSVIIDRAGVVRLVHRGGGGNVEIEVAKILAEQIRK